MSDEFTDPENTEWVSELLVGVQAEEAEEDSEPESPHDRSLRWLDELVTNVQLSDELVVQVAAVYVLKDLVAVLRKS